MKKMGGIEAMVHGASADGRGEQTGSAYFASGTGDEVCGGRGNLRIAKLSISSSDRIRMSAGSWALTRFDGQHSTFTVEMVAERKREPMMARDRCFCSQLSSRITGPKNHRWCDDVAE